MEEVYQELIEAKLNLAETNETLLMKSQEVKQLTELHSKRQEEIKKMQEEVQSLYDSISQISEERDNLLMLLQDSPRSITIQSLDLDVDHFIEKNYSQSSAELWHTIFENWNKVKLSKKLRKLLRRGIHSSYRGKIWLKIMENRLFINDKLFSILSTKQGQEYDLPSDLKRNLSISQCESINKVLSCFLTHRLDIQYSHTLAYLSYIFVTSLQDYEAFYMLSNFINNFEVVRSFMLGNNSCIQNNYRVIEHYLKKMTPDLLEALNGFGVYLDIMIMENICCVFAKCAPVEYVNRLIDAILIEDEQYFMKVAIAVFTSLNEVIKEKELDSVMNGMNNLHLYLPDPEKILNQADKVKISSTEVNNIKNIARNRTSAWF